jgi:hypothetical protein
MPYSIRINAFITHMIKIILLVLVIIFIRLSSRISLINLLLNKYNVLFPIRVLTNNTPFFKIFNFEFNLRKVNVKMNEKNDWWNIKALKVSMTLTTMHCWTIILYNIVTNIKVIVLWKTFLILIKLKNKTKKINTIKQSRKIKLK